MNTQSQAPAGLLHRYQEIASDRKYSHFARIPQRIVRCLDHFGVNCDRVAVESRLRAYYLFIGVIDNAIDSGQAEVRDTVLRHFESTPGCFNELTNASEIALATEALKLEIPDEIYVEAIAILRALSQAVQREPSAPCVAKYIEARESVGQLTARLSYVLIRPLLDEGSVYISRFMERVGEIGCLVDSLIDVYADRRNGLLNFQPTLRNFVRLLTHTSRRGTRLSIEHPYFIGLFLEAIADNVLDRFRARANDESRIVPGRISAKGRAIQTS